MPRAAQVGNYWAQELVNQMGIECNVWLLELETLVLLNRGGLVKYDRMSIEPSLYVRFIWLVVQRMELMENI